MTGKIVAAEFIRKNGSGDVHVVVYDLAKKQTYIAHGITDEHGNYVKKAHQCPFLRFDNEKLGAEQWPDIKISIELKQWQ